MKAKMKAWTARNTTEEVRLLDREAKLKEVSRSELVREILSPWFAKHRKEKKSDAPVEA
jgi:hypothetical protein